MMMHDYAFLTGWVGMVVVVCVMVVLVAGFVPWLLAES